MAETRSHAEARPCVDVCLAVGWVAVHVDEVGPRRGVFVQTIPEAAPQRDIAADLPQFVQSSAVRDFPHCPPVDLLILAGFEHSGTAKCAGWTVEYLAVGQADAMVFGYGSRGGYASVSAFQHISGRENSAFAQISEINGILFAFPPGSRSDCAESA